MYPNLLQPSPIQAKECENISMDFIEELAKARGKDVIFVVLDRLSKAAHFMALKQPYTALEVAQVFMDNVFKLHSTPKSVVSDRDVAKFGEGCLNSKRLICSLSLPTTPWIKNISDQ